MGRSWPRSSWAVLVLLAMAACTVATSATDLHPEGPPMIEQVRLVEIYSSGTGQGLERVVFGFGTHPMASSDDEHPVTTAKAATNTLRIIMDELLRGNNLEEIQCRAKVDDDDFARVPLGTTPDDIARCSAAPDMLPSLCPGSNRLSVCICQDDGGCMTGTTLTPKGQSVGVLDRDQDGAADHTRFIDGAVRIVCGSIDAPLVVPLDLELSYWTPSGDQQTPVHGGFDALGPAVVVVPSAALPTGMACGVAFSPEVVDKDGNRVCAPPGGDITKTCVSGDTSAFRFTVEPLGFALGQAIMDPGQPRTADIALKANVPLDPGSLANITVTEASATTYTQITIHWTAPGGLAATTRYTITLSTGVTDAYHQPAPQPFEIAFTTGAG
jgi:Big-like domain-containing protein